MTDYAAFSIAQLYDLIKTGHIVHPLALKDHLHHRRVALLKRRDTCHAQLVAAKQQHHLTGEYADAAWFQRTNVALRCIKRELQQLQDALGLLKRQIKNEQHTTQYLRFVTVARRVLDQSTYQRIMELALQ